MKIDYDIKCVFMALLLNCEYTQRQISKEYTKFIMTLEPDW